MEAAMRQRVNCENCGHTSDMHSGECVHCGAPVVPKIASKPVLDRDIEHKEKFQGPLRKVFGFMLGFGTVAILEILVIYLIGELLNSRIVPRGPGWIFIPVVAGVAGWKLLRDVNFTGAFGHAVHEMTTMNQLNRLLIAAYGSWALIVGGYAFFADPYGYRISVDEWVQIVKILMVPMAVLTAILFLFRWALRK